MAGDLMVRRASLAHHFWGRSREFHGRNPMDESWFERPKVERISPMGVNPGLSSNNG